MMVLTRKHSKRCSSIKSLVVLVLFAGGSIVYSWWNLKFLISGSAADEECDGYTQRFEGFTKLHLEHSQNLEGHRQKVVIVMTQCRSGSSFVGETLASSSSSMYLYEPLFSYGMNCHKSESLKEELLVRLLNCNFTGLKEEHNLGFNISGFPDYGQCKKNEYCFAKDSLGLLKGYAKTCNRMMNKTSEWKFKPESRDCGYPLKDYILHEQCKTSEMIVTKVTRICSLDQIERVYSSLTRNGKDVHVIHLVRDPR